jgi:hypothetical protein
MLHPKAFMSNLHDFTVIMNQDLLQMKTIFSASQNITIVIFAIITCLIKYLKPILEESKLSHFSLVHKLIRAYVSIKSTDWML